VSPGANHKLPFVISGTIAAMLPSTIKTAPFEVVKTKPANAAVRQRKCFIDRNLLPPGNGSDPGAHLNEIPAKAQPPRHGVFLLQPSGIRQENVLEIFSKFVWLAATRITSDGSRTGYKGTSAPISFLQSTV